MVCMSNQETLAPYTGRHPFELFLVALKSMGMLVECKSAQPVNRMVIWIRSSFWRRILFSCYVSFMEVTYYYSTPSSRWTHWGIPFLAADGSDEAVSISFWLPASWQSNPEALIWGGISKMTDSNLTCCCCCCCCCCCLHTAVCRILGTSFEIDANRMKY